MLFRFLNLIVLTLLVSCFFAEIIIYQFVFHQALEFSHITPIIFNFFNDFAILAVLFYLFYLLKQYVFYPVLIFLYSAFIGVILLFVIANILFIMKTGALLDLSLIIYTFSHFSDTLFVLLGSLRNKYLWFCSFIILGFCLLYLANRQKSNYQKPVFIPIFCSIWLIISLQVASPLFNERSIYKGLILTPFAYTRPFKQFDEVQSDYIIEDLSAYKNKEVVMKPPSTVVFIIVESLRNDMFNSHSDVIPFISSIKDKGYYFSNSYTTVNHSSKALYSLFCGVLPNLTMAIQESDVLYNKSYCLPHWFSDIGYETLFLQSADGVFENRAGLVDNMGFQNFVAGEELHTGGAVKLGYFAQDDAYLLPALDSWLVSKKDQPVFISIFNSNTHHTYDLAGQPCVTKDRDCYIKALHYYDNVLQDIFTLIEEERGLEDTLFVILGDHGEAFAEKGLSQHDGVPYEEVVNVPLIFYGKGFKQGVDDNLRWLLDIPLTFMQKFVGSNHAGYQLGKNLFKSSGHEKLVSYCWYENVCMAIRDKNNKFIVHLNSGAVEVFPAYPFVNESIEKKNFDTRKTEQAIRYGFELKKAIEIYHQRFEP